MVVTTLPLQFALYAVRRVVLPTFMNEVVFLPVRLYSLDQNGLASYCLVVCNSRQIYGVYKLLFPLDPLFSVIILLFARK